MKATRCKFKVTSVTESEGDIVDVLMHPVTSDSDPQSENSTFFKYTPGGEIKFQTLNKAATEDLIPGRECYVDITPLESD